MTLLEHTLLLVALLCYLLGTATQHAYLVRSDRRLVGVSIALFTAGFAIHALETAIEGLRLGYLPVLSWQEATDFYGLVIMAAYLVVQYTYRIRAIGAFVGPLVVVLVIAALFLPGAGTEQLRPELRSVWFHIHVPLAFMGEALFGVAAIVGLMWLIQDYQLRKRSISSAFHRLPSLDVLDEVGYRCLAIGFPLLTLAIVTGSLWSMDAFGDYWRWLPKEVWSLVTWLLYAALLHGRLLAGWRGRRASIGSIAGFTMVLASFFLTSHFI